MLLKVKYFMIQLHNPYQLFGETKKCLLFWSNHCIAHIYFKENQLKFLGISNWQNNKIIPFFSNKGWML